MDTRGGVTLDLTKSILVDIRTSNGLMGTSTDFDTDLLQHINSSIGKLNQNGIGKIIVVEDDSTVWGDLKDDTQTAGNDYFQSIPLFITLSTRLLFDPPPPSTVQQYVSSAQESLWRLKIAYEEPYVKEV